MKASKCSGNNCTNTPKHGSLFCRPCAIKLGVGAQEDNTTTCLVVSCSSAPIDNTNYCKEHTEAKRERIINDKAMMFACRVMAEAIVIYAEPTLLGTMVEQMKEISNDDLPMMMMEIEETMRAFSSFLYLKEDEIWQELGEDV